MEIIDYLRIARRHLMVLVGVPLLAGALAVAYVMLSPRPYTATVYVSPPSLMGSQYGTYAGASGATQFVNDFSAQAVSPAVTSAVARAEHVSAADVSNGVTVTQVNLSSQVQLTYTTTDRKTAGPVALAVARQAMKRLFASQVRVAAASVAAATKSMHAVNAALAIFTEKNGGLPVDQQQAALTAQITKLREERALDLSTGLTQSAHIISGKLARLNSRVAKLAPLAGAHADLVARQLAAQDALTNSQQVLAQAQAQATSATAPQAVQSTPTVRVPLSHRLILSVLPALAVGVILAIALMALLELDARRRRVPRGRAPHSPRHETRVRDSSSLASFVGE